LRSQSIELLARKLKHKIRREAMAVTFDGFIEAKRGDAPAAAGRGRYPASLEHRECSECGDEESKKNSNHTIADVIEIGIGRVTLKPLKPRG
jgi:hypothetical protein